MQIVKKQCDTKQEMFDLYVHMISMYEDFSKDNILEQHVWLQGIYNSLFKQTIKCTVFIEGYAKKSGISMFKLQSSHDILWYFQSTSSRWIYQVKPQSFVRLLLT